MMKHKKIIITILIFSLMIASYGCTVEKETLDTNGDALFYKEIILSDTLGEEYISGIVINNDNELVLCSQGDNNKYLILDEKGEIKKEIKADFSGSKDVFAVNNENNMYILSEIQKRNENKDIIGLDKKLISYKNESDSINAEDIIAELSDSTVRITQDMTIQIEVDSKRNIYALKLNGSIEVYDSSLKSKKIIDSVQYKDIEIDEEDNLYALHEDIQKKTLEKIDTNSYKTMWRKEYKNTDAPESIYYNKNTKSLYGVNTDWIVKYDLEGNMKNRILNTGELSTIDYIIDFAVDDKEEIYLIAQNEDKYNLIKYTKLDAETGENKEVEEEKTEITIELWKDYFNFFTNLSKQFEKKYPNIDIIVKTSPDLDYKKYREKLNTELMAGKGSDILLLDIYDYKRIYSEKGILLNLDDMIENDKDFNIDDYNKRIIDMERHNGELYTMPMNYGWFYGLVLNEKLLDEKGIILDDDMTWRDVYNLSEKLNKNSEEKIYVLPKMNDEILFKDLVLLDIDYYMDFEKKEAKFDSQGFIDTIKLFKSIKKDEVMNPEIVWEDIVYDRLRKDMDFSNIVIYPSNFSVYADIRLFGSLFNNNFKVVLGPKGECTGNRHFFSRSLSINNNSKYKKKAWEFIKFIISDEIQTTNKVAIEGEFSINNKASEKQIAEVFKFQEKYKQSMERNYYYAKEEDIKEVDRIKANINKLFINDPFYDVIYEEIQPFLNGEKTAEETAMMIQNKAEIYLLE